MGPCFGSVILRRVRSKRGSTRNLRKVNSANLLNFSSPISEHAICASLRVAVFLTKQSLNAKPLLRYGGSPGSEMVVDPSMHPASRSFSQVP